MSLSLWALCHLLELLMMVLWNLFMKITYLPTGMDRWLSMSEIEIMARLITSGLTGPDRPYICSVAYT